MEIVMKKLRNLEDLVHHQLKDIYRAETQLIKALPKMHDKASDQKLKQAFAKHLEETKEHVNRLENIAGELGLSLSGETCKAMQGLIEEAKSFISEDAESHIRDAGIIADAQRIEHYEISAYGTVVEYAKALGSNKIATLLQKTLDEESKADSTLSEIAVNNVNKKAKVNA